MFKEDAFVGADAHIGPLGSCEFAADFRKNGAFCRADVGIGPYKGSRAGVWKDRAAGGRHGLGWE